MSEQLLRRISLGQLADRNINVIDEATLSRASEIVEDVRTNGDEALLRWSREFGDLSDSGDSHVLTRDRLEAAFKALPTCDQELLMRVADRIRCFAKAQLGCATELSVLIDGGMAGHTWAPLKVAGCYAPGGRFPLPSSVLMTVVTARVAGVKKVWACSPKPSLHTLAAAFVGNADALLTAGGAQAIAAMAYGTESVECSDIIVGPGNRWVTAAKQIVSAGVKIDMLAGPTELLIVADDSADASLVAANLLAQAEHDEDAMPMLISLSDKLVAKVNSELANQLAELRTASTARKALQHGFSLVVEDFRQAVAIAEKIAPEHLQLVISDAGRMASAFSNYGALFIGQFTPEVLGDYGAGPNHVLPTCGMARTCGGLSVFSFLSLRTWLRIDNVPAAASIVADAKRLATIEGLHAHEKAAAYLGGLLK
ncbi:MAG: histidinol dehydrogenase [Deltaproteobacteria bacterium]|nr:histidinol dehydrogenase [Deltaproteobacteria bacterium]